MITLQVVARYANAARGLSYQPGQMIEVDDALADYLRRDAPDCFALAAPLEHRAVLAPRVSQAVPSKPKGKR